MNTRILGLLAASVLFFSSCAPKPDQSRSGASFAPALQAGTSWTNTVVVAQTITQEISGRAIEAKQDFSTTYRFKVLGRGEKDSLSMEASYERLKLDMKSPAGSISFDSGDSVDPSSPLGVMTALIGGRFTFKLGTDLKVSEVGGLSELAAKMAAAAKDPALASMASSYLNESSIRQSLESLFGLFPTRSIRPGESWTSSSSLNTGVSASMKSKLTAIKVAGDQISTKVEGEIEPLEKGATSELRGHLSGSLELNAASLRILDGNISQSLSGKIAINGTSIPITVTSSIRYE
jgi:hypothetical protein